MTLFATFSVVSAAPRITPGDICVNICCFIAWTVDFSSFISAPWVYFCVQVEKPSFCGKHRPQSETPNTLSSVFITRFSVSGSPALSVHSFTPDLIPTPHRPKVSPTSMMADVVRRVSAAPLGLFASDWDLRLFIDSIPWLHEQTTSTVMTMAPGRN